MKIIRNTIITFCISLLFLSCGGLTEEKAFLAKYEFEDFSQFKGIEVHKRGGDENHQMLTMIVSNLQNDSSKAGFYLVTLDKINFHVVEANWTNEHYVYPDTLKLQQLAQTFMNYKIPRLCVDTVGNVFIYLIDIETLSLVRFANENELLKRSKEVEWTKVKDNWYK
jgi:hypothetical protein